MIVILTKDSSSYSMRVIRVLLESDFQTKLRANTRHQMSHKCKCLCILCKRVQTNPFICDTNISFLRNGKSFNSDII